VKPDQLGSNKFGKVEAFDCKGIVLPLLCETTLLMLELSVLVSDARLDAAPGVGCRNDFLGGSLLRHFARRF
jgi:hypothetical protein